MADDHDALMDRCDNWCDAWSDEEGIAHNLEGRDLMFALGNVVRDLRADRIAALEVIARLTEGWDVSPLGSTWHRHPDVEPMSDREWRVFCEAAQRATRNTT
jgi:hypothetical protein